MFLYPFIICNCSLIHLDMLHFYTGWQPGTFYCTCAHNRDARSRVQTDFKPYELYALQFRHSIWPLNLLNCIFFLFCGLTSSTSTPSLTRTRTLTVSGGDGVIRIRKLEEVLTSRPSVNHRPSTHHGSRVYTCLFASLFHLSEKLNEYSPVAAHLMSTLGQDNGASPPAGRSAELSDNQRIRRFNEGSHLALNIRLLTLQENPGYVSFTFWAVN